MVFVGYADKFAAAIGILRKYIPYNIPINMYIDDKVQRIYVLFEKCISNDDISKEDWNKLDNYGLRYERPYYIFYI